MKKRIIAIGMCMMMLAGCGNKTPSKAEIVQADIQETVAKGEREAAFEQEESLPEMSEAATEEDSAYSFNVGGSSLHAAKANSSAASAASGGSSFASAASGASSASSAYRGNEFDEYEYNTEEYNEINENGFCDALTQPLSTFAADVDTGSYSNFRRMVNDGYGLYGIPRDAVRVEEMLNYFDYDMDEEYISDGAFSVQYETGTCPWNSDSKLLYMTVEANRTRSPYEGNNYVFLIDTSGSMDREEKIDLCIKAFKKFANTLQKDDRVSVVTYAGSSEVLLEGAKGNNEDKIDEAFDEAYKLCVNYGGGTNGSGGIEAAYKVAESNFIKGGNNRVILASDGDMNLGITSNEGLVDLITEKKEKGIFLTTLGFGTGNYSDANMEAIADAGNGNYYYIDCMDEAKRVLCDKASQSFITVAKDVKFQVEFNPACVSEYRLVGYENRVMAARDFKDDTKDGGEVGAGAQVTVLYELKMSDSDAGIDLKYQDKRTLSDAADSDELCTVSVRYKKPSRDESTEEEYVIKDTGSGRSDNFKFASAVAEAALVITDSDHKGDANLENAIERAEDAAGKDELKKQFPELLEKLLEDAYD